MFPNASLLHAMLFATVWLGDHSEAYQWSWYPYRTVPEHWHWSPSLPQVSQPPCWYAAHRASAVASVTYSLLYSLTQVPRWVELALLQHAVKAIVASGLAHIGRPPRQVACLKPNRGVTRTALSKYESSTHGGLMNS